MSVGYIPRIENAGSCGNSRLTFKRTAKLLSKTVLQSSPVVYEGFDFSTSSSTLVICSFYLNRPSGCEVVPHCGFGLHFPDD